MAGVSVRDAPRQVTGEPLEWWEHLRVWCDRRRQTFRERHPGLAQLVGLSRLGLVIVGLIWLSVIAIWFPNVRSGMGAYLGSMWILICCILAARTRTLSWRTCLRVFGFAVPWSVAIGLVSVWLSDLVFLTSGEAALGGGDADVHGSASSAVGASVAIAALTEEALKVLPVALVVVLAARRVRRFAIIDWLLLGVASGVAFQAVEELFRRIYLMDPNLQGGVLDFCAQRPPGQRIDCFDIDQFGIWPIGAGAFSGEYVSYAGHHVLTGLVTVAVGLAIAAWRASRSSRFLWLVRVAAVAAPALMFWIAVVDHMGRNAVAAGGDDEWLTSEGTTIPWVVRFTFEVTGGGDGRTLLLVVLFVLAVFLDARRYARYGYPVSGPAVRDHSRGPDVAGAGQQGGVLAWLVSQARADVRRASEVVRDALPQLNRLSRQPSRSARLGVGSRVLAACGRVWRVLWTDVAQGVAAHSRGPGESRGEAIRSGCAFWSMQRQARQLVGHVAAERGEPGRFLAVRYRVVGLAALLALLAVGLVVAPMTAAEIGPELTTGDDRSWWWLAGRLDDLAGWWDGLSTTQQVALSAGAAAVLTIPFGFAGGLFVAGIGTYVADHGSGIGDLIDDPEGAVKEYVENASPGGVLADLGELLLTFMPPAFGAASGVGGKQLAKEYLADPAAFWRKYRAQMRDETGAIEIGRDGIAVVNGRRTINSQWAGRVFDGPQWTDALRAKYPDGVRFTGQGFPDFSPYAKETLDDLPLTMNRNKDFQMANESMGWKRRPRGWTWHHVEDGKTLQLIPTDLHKAIGHAGGVAAMK